ncbi:MAG: hypothetical protein HN867_18585 [Deltaproteobacteria bacterium]|nr:hypothetical protein [Deltaproteobacteria bacterium]MBT7205462.1 hypothetical protein [Deltaproteobacteria bacterium]
MPELMKSIISEIKQILCFLIYKITSNYFLPPSAEVSKMELHEELWNETNLWSVESTQIKASRKFGNFDEFWNINTSSPALSVVLEDLSPQEISEICSSPENQLHHGTSGCIVCEAHTNAIKGIA